MKTKPYMVVAAALLATTAASSAQAATMLHFAITGGYNASFDLGQNPLPDYVSSTSFDIDNVAGTFAGTTDGGKPGPASATTASAIQFYTSSFGGGIGISAGGVTRFVADGAQLFSGSTATPSFLVGTYALAPEYGYGTSLLSISQVTSAVPEPGTWSMLLLGIGALGFAMRRRQNVTTQLSYAG